jgi:hypothetical protein
MFTEAISSAQNEYYMARVWRALIGLYTGLYITGLWRVGETDVKCPKIRVSGWLMAKLFERRPALDRGFNGAKTSMEGSNMVMGERRALDLLQGTADFLG